MRLRYFVIALFFLWSAPSLAQQRALNSDAKDNIDAILLIDASGSMRLTDPQQLRFEGAELFSQLLSDGDRLGIIAFDEKTRVLRPLSPYASDQRAAIKGAITSAGDNGEYTNLLAGVREAAAMLAASPSEHAQPLIVLLSDGKMESATADSLSLTSELLDKVAPTLKTSGVKVYTLAFSDLADKDLLSQLAASTGAVNWFTPDATKIHESYADLFLAAKKPQVVPMTKKGFKIDRDVQEATFYIDRTTSEENVEVLTPVGGRIYQESPPVGVRWFKGTKFDVVTIQKPDPGDWQILGVDANDGYATVLTNLKLQTEWPTSFRAGDTVLLQARLYESEKPVVLPEMTASGQYAFQITSSDQVSEPLVRELLADNGEHGDEVANDGIFSRAVTLEEPGEYRMRIVAKAPTFERNQQIPFRVRPRIISLRVEEAAHVDTAHPVAEHGAEAQHHGASAATEEKQTAFIVEVSNDAEPMKIQSLKVIAVNNEHKKFSLPVQKISEKLFKAPASALPKNGMYLIQAELEAEAKGKKTIRGKTKEINFEAIETHGEILHEVVAEERSTSVPDKESPIVPIILLLALHAAGFAGAFMVLKKALAGGAVSFPELPAIDEMQQGVETLKEIAARAEVDLNDPRFHGAEPVKSQGAEA